MAFQFRFETLLQIRRRERDEAAVAVGQADEAIHRIETQIAEIGTKREAERERTAHNRTGQISVDNLLVQGRYDLQLEAQVLALRQTLDELHNEAARRRQALNDAEAEVKRLERLQEKDRLKYVAELRRREQFESDDATARQYTIQRQAHRNDHQTP